jgi:hypothetical protein
VGDGSLSFMRITSLMAEGEHLRDLPVPPIVIAGGTFVLLLMLIAVVLVYGRGRPHS